MGFVPEGTNPILLETHSADIRVCGVECDRAVALIDDVEYGNNCGLWTSNNMWCVTACVKGVLSV